jgi:transcriptional regulator with XRE-family HTH domain
MQESTRKVILRLKEAREQKNLTYQDIVDACEAQNESVSLSTVRRIFSKGSEDGADYRPYTINALFRAVIGTEEIELTDAEEAAMTEAEKEVVTENSALKAVVEMKDATIADLQQQIESLISEKESLEQKVSILQIRLETMTDIIRVSMEAIGKSARS